jgi:hypothetical protein
MRFLTLPPKGTMYNSDDVVRFLAKSLRIGHEEALGLIPAGATVRIGAFVEYNVIVAKSLDEIVSFKLTSQGNKEFVSKFFKPGTIVAIHDQADLKLKNGRVTDTRPNRLKLQKACS